MEIAEYVAWPTGNNQATRGNLSSFVAFDALYQMD
jgi:hypothetical protein